MEMETTIRNRYLKLAPEDFEVLNRLRGERSWSEFIGYLSKLLNHELGQQTYYFKKNLMGLNLSDDQVCRLCKKRTVHPEVLTEIDYLKLVHDYAVQKGIDISESQLQQRFNESGLEGTTLGCPHCYAYEGYLTFESLLDSVLPEYSIGILKDIYQSMKCNTKA